MILTSFPRPVLGRGSLSHAGNNAFFEPPLTYLTATGGPVTTVIPVPDEGRIGEARRAATALADGLDETTVGRVAVIATELATNLARHAHQGALFLRRIDAGAATSENNSVPSIEVLAVDRGPGITDITRSMRDGFSTQGTAGNGLGAVSRMSEWFDIYSVPGKGTIVSCRVFPALSRKETEQMRDRRFDLGVVCVPLTGESASGDGWATHRRPDGTVVVMLADGLGHGTHAAEAADVACATFRAAMQRSATPADAMNTLHLALRPTRGAAIAIAEIDPVHRTVHFSGIGNVAGMITGERNQNLVSLNGIVGHQVGRLREFAYEWPVGAMLVLASDGLVSRWNVDAYPGLLSRHPSILCATLFRECARGRDDATVLALRDAPDVPLTTVGAHG